MFTRHTSRRRLLLGVLSGTLALTLPTSLSVHARAPRGPKKTLAQDIVQGPREFGRGTALGAQARSNGLAGPGTFESEVIASAFPFTHAGIHWRAAGPDIVIEVRTSYNGLAWTDWRKVQLEFPDEESLSGENYGALIGSERDSHLQYRATLPAGSDLSSVSVTFLNVEDGEPLEASSLLTCASPAGKPVTFTREQWGADEAIRSGSPAYLPVKRVILHHTVSASDFAGDLEGAMADMRAMYYYHAVTQGWGDIAYHYLIDGDGNVFEGRRGREGSTADDADCGREVASEGVRGTHTANHNDETTSIAAIGNFEPGYGSTLQPSEALIASIIRVAAFECAREQFDPLLSNHHLRTDDFWSTNLPLITYHGQCSGNATACCGQYLIARLSSIRSGVEAALGRGGPSVQLTAGPNGSSVNNGRAAFTWSGAGSTSVPAYEVCLVGFSLAKRTLAVQPLIGLNAGYRTWTNVGAATSANFTSLGAGHYTFYVRPVGGQYAAHRTFLAKGKR